MCCKVHKTYKPNTVLTRTYLAKRALSKHLKQLKLSWISPFMSFFGDLIQFKLMCFIAVIVVFVVLMILVLVVTIVVVILEKQKLYSVLADIATKYLITLLH